MDAVDVINWLNNQKEITKQMYWSVDKDIKSDEKRTAKGREPYLTLIEHEKHRKSCEINLEVIDFLIKLMRERIEIKK
ncbi:MAG: hypothetical protein PHU59_05370 [Candidatus Omnitrophica bacterium]|nr:hypothetical protein [Candidatus Omnitrophota bacterium]